MHFSTWGLGDPSWGFPDCLLVFRGGMGPFLWQMLPPSPTGVSALHPGPRPWQGGLCRAPGYGRWRERRQPPRALPPPAGGGGGEAVPAPRGAGRGGIRRAGPRRACGGRVGAAPLRCPEAAPDLPRRQHRGEEAEAAGRGKGKGKPTAAAGGST